MTIQGCLSKKLKNCQTMTCGLGILVIVNIMVVLTACSATPKPIKQAQQKQKAAIAAKTDYRPLPVQAVATGLTNVYWDIDVINGIPARNFGSQPYLFFWGSNNQISGSTGCNALYGKYREAKQQLLLDAWAGYINCGGALPQEAELMDSLARITGYQLNQNVLQLFDAQHKVLIRAHKR